MFKKLGLLLGDIFGIFSSRYTPLLQDKKFDYYRTLMSTVQDLGLGTIFYCVGVPFLICLVAKARFETVKIPADFKTPAEVREFLHNEMAGNEEWRSKGMKKIDVDNVMNYCI